MKNTPPSFSKHLSMPGLLSKIRKHFCTIPDHRTKNINISLPDALMSGLAMFTLRYSSLLQFDINKNEETTKATKKRFMVSKIHLAIHKCEK